MRLISVLTGLGLAASSLASATPRSSPAVALPLASTSRWIVDAQGRRVKLKCINWAGHMETHLPEGLHRQSIDFVADWVHAQGFNCVRLTYSIDHALDPNRTIADAFAKAATAANVPPANMTALYNLAVVANPFLGKATTTTRDVFGAVVDALWARGVMTVLDNHVSRASWCCDLSDGNGWWSSAKIYVESNSRYFDEPLWMQGLVAMAAWARDGHPGVVAMSLRNELRPIPVVQDFDGDLPLVGTHSHWYTSIESAGTAVHNAHPDVLVIVGGVAGATDLSRVRELGRMLDTSGWPGKHVWEWHSYSFSISFPHDLPCNAMHDLYGALDGFLLEQNKVFTGPLFLSEFGAGLQGGPNGTAGLNSVDSTYLKCLVDYMIGNDADWSVWAIQGSYYIRGGQTDYEETWGLLNYDWSASRYPAFTDMLGDMWKVTQGP